MQKRGRKTKRIFKLWIVTGLVLFTALGIYLYASMAMEAGSMAMEAATQEDLFRAEGYVASDRYREAVEIYDDLLLKEEDAEIRTLRENVMTEWKAYTDREPSKSEPEPIDAPVAIDNPQPAEVPLPPEKPGEGNPKGDEGPPSETPQAKWTIVIDPGHQKLGDSTMEPVGPGSTVMKKKVSSGTRGTTTGIYEYRYVLDVSLLIRDLLEAEGFHVLMTRIDHEVTLSNVDRAKIANEAEADLFLRIHANGSDNPAVHGISTYTPPGNSPYNPDLAEKSEKIALLLLEEMVKATGAKDRGNHKSVSYTGINWSEVPVVILETGFMTNPEEDRLLATTSYQEKMAGGIANAVRRYFEE